MDEARAAKRRRVSRPSRAEATAFEQLDADVPLLLLPVRIETVFQRRGDNAARKSDRANQPESLSLLVRIYPDYIHADTHTRELSSEEIELGQRFWTKAWSASITDQRHLQTFTHLASQLGPFRAAWVLEATRPLNWDRRATTDKSQLPRFPTPEQRKTVSPGKARLLPDRWVVSGYQRNELLFTESGKQIPRDLPISPDFAATGPGPKSMAQLLSTQGLAWLTDFDEAVKVGMGLRLPLGNGYLPQIGLDLFVVGARNGDTPLTVAKQFADLLATHHWTHGVDVARRGTPTNNSDHAYSGVSLSEPDLTALLNSVLNISNPPSHTSEPLHRRRSDDAAILALGLAPGSILERASQHDGAVLDLTGAMSAALWPATWGYFLRTMLGNAVDDQWINWLRRHFITRVKPGGLLPSIRVGNQPYGLLPVAQEQTREHATEQIDKLENLLLSLLQAWETAAKQRVARLDVDAADTPPASGGDPSILGGATTTLARILGATPNPSDLTLTPVSNERDNYATTWGLVQFMLGIIIGQALPTVAEELGDALASAKTLEEQIATFKGLINDGSSGDTVGTIWLASLSTHPDTGTAGDAALALIKNNVLPFLDTHRRRMKPVIDRGPSRTKVTGKMADAHDPPLFFSLFGENEERISWAGPLVARDNGTTEEIHAWLGALLTEARDATQSATYPGEHAPLLFQLLKRSISVVHDADRADMQAGLQALVAALGSRRSADPIADLELLMGEVLGACMHRIDAWLSAGAAERLEAVREARPQGLEVGGYCWVLGLKPSQKGEPSQGFIHAPSLDHAATAAILRSGWSALGDGALGVDVSSARVRAASWIIDGVRDGHPLDELLGQSLERRLHDAFLDRHIEPIRRVVLQATGRAEEQPVTIVDGFVVARAWLGGDDVAPLTAEEADARKKLKKLVDGAKDDATSLNSILDAHAADLDAVADASVFSSVHAIVRGNTARAAATLASTGDAISAPPPLTALRTSRGGQRIEHRIVLLLEDVEEDDETANPPTSPQAIAEPNLEAWAAATFPRENIGFGIWIEENSVKIWDGPHTLAEIGIGALELLAMLPNDDHMAVGHGLTRRIAWHFERKAAGEGRLIKVTVDPELTGGHAGGTFPLALALAAARSLQSLIHSGRALDDSDLSTVKLASTADVGRIGGRYDDLIDVVRDAQQRLRSAIDTGASTGEVLDACADFAAWQITGAIPRAGLSNLVNGNDDDDREALLREANAIYDRVQKRLDAHDAVKGNDLKSILARMRALLPGAVILPPIKPVEIDSIRTTGVRSIARLGTPQQAIPWLHQVGRVRDHVQTAAVAVDLVEAASGMNKFVPTLIQFPDHETEEWAARSKPTQDTLPRTCIISLTPLATSASLAGLAIDTWTEVIPDLTAATGLAVHFDSPSARPPQAWLLATAPRSKRWTHDDVLGLVRQTLDRARQRAVSPDEIEGYGQYLPAVYLADSIDPGPVRMRNRS